MGKLKQALVFLRLVDAHDGTVSLTSVALWVVLFKVAVAQSVEMTEVATLMLALLQYSAKKVINRRPKDDSGALEAVTEKLASLETKIAAVGAFKSAPRR